MNSSVVRIGSVPFSVLLGISLLNGLMSPAYGVSISLGDLPLPFVSVDGVLNCTIVVASSSGHGPCGAAHTMDVMGGILISEKLGLVADAGALASALDDYITSYDFVTGRLSVMDSSSNLVAVGGPGVNSITWYYNDLRNGSGGRALPIYFDKDANGTDHIHVASSGNSYYIEYDTLGRVKADYALVELCFDGSRFVLILGGLGGAGTWAACKVLASYEQWNLSGYGVAIKYFDSDADGNLDSIVVVEKSYSQILLSGYQATVFSQSWPIQVGSLSFVILAGCNISLVAPSTRRRQKILRVFNRVVIVGVILSLIVLSQSIFVSFPRLEFSNHTLADFSSPFVGADDVLECIIVVASSSGHGPCGSAHTMDVVGAVLLGAQFGLDANNGTPASTMDDYISVYDYGTAKLTLRDTSSNLVAVGGPGVNSITWYYNNLRNGSGGRALPIYFDKNASGADYIHVESSGNSYYMEHDALGRVKADYALMELYGEAEYGRHVLIIGGLGGTGTWAACKVLSNYRAWSFFGKAFVVKYYDSDENGFLDVIEIVEVVSTEDLVGVYWDAGCWDAVPSIDWGVLEPGSTKNITIYVRNEGRAPVMLSLNATNWNPVNASEYMVLKWDYGGQQVGVGQVVKVRLSLWVSPIIAGITDFTMDIVVTGNG